jgi:hypothetical protein
VALQKNAMAGMRRQSSGAICIFVMPDVDFAATFCICERPACDSSDKICIREMPGPHRRMPPQFAALIRLTGTG